MDIALITYNNSFNRIVKRLNTFTEYKQANYDKTHDDILDFSDVNFNPNDGLTTEIVIGTSKELDWLDHGPDYAILHEEDDVISRWFITGIQRERQGQYRIGLKRDVLAEYRENVLEAPCYVEKGTIRDVTDPLLFNSEGMSFNQIKKDQIPLKDKTGMAWLVGYISKDVDEKIPDQSKKTITHTYIDSSDYDFTDSEIDFADCISYDDIEGNPVSTATKNACLVNNGDSRFRMRSRAPVEVGDEYTNDRQYMNITWDLDANQISRAMGVGQLDWEGLNSVAMVILPWNGSRRYLTPTQYYGCVDGWSQLARGQDSTVTGAWTGMTSNAASELNATNTIVNEDIYREKNGKRILHNGAVYTLMITPQSDMTKDVELTLDNSHGAYLDAFLRALASVSGWSIDNVSWAALEDDAEPTKIKAKITLKYTQYIIRAREIQVDDSFSFTLPPVGTGPDHRNACPDAQYDMFALPITAAGLGFSVSGDDMKDTLFQKTIQTAGADTPNDDTDDVFVTKEAYINGISKNQLLISQLLCTELGEHVFDIQLLPYCPMDFVYFNGSNYTTYQFLEGDTNSCILDNINAEDYSLIMTNGGDIAGIIFWPKKAMFSKNIPLTLPNEYESREPYTIDNPTLTYNNVTHQGDPVYRLEFPDKATGTLSTSDVVLPTQVEASWMALSYNGSNGHPCIYLTSDQLPHSPSASQRVTLTGMQITLTANWVFSDDAERLKVRNECEFQRLVSPNFNGMFEFKKCKMSGGVHNINVDCLYKPYQPYIKLNPDYSFLYGQDFNDSTGLRLGGDFSLPRTVDAFIEYELQNKNYQAIFARGIENMDVNNQIAKEKQIYNGVMGTLTGAGAGAVMGLKKGGPVGALGGAALGGGMAALNAAVNYSFLERTQEENRDFAIDNFNYQLGNIQALPQSITKSTPLTYNNTVWPVIEIYDATDEEKELLKNKLRYDGMTIMKVAKLSDYEAEGGYLKGKLIRLDIDANSQVANQIYQEVDRGFYTE